MQNVKRSFLLVLAVAGATAALGFVSACTSPEPDDNVVSTGGATHTEAATVGEVQLDEHGEPAGLHRHKKWSELIHQGAQPEGEIAFQNLAAMGIKTVISVDGARPDAEAAERHGLRYVHVPIGYHGLTRDQQLQIVKAVETSDGPVYVHCHHGKHRGPAGVMVARITLEGIDHATAVADLEASGCSPKYKGLYRDTANFVPPTAEELAAVSADLPSYVAAAALVDAMVDVDFRSENLGQCREAGWDVPAGNPDVSPPHEARMLWEHYRELARLDESKQHGDRFVQLLADNEEAAKALEESLRAGDKDGADGAWKRVKDGCGTCHEDYRNNK